MNNSLKFETKAEVSRAPAKLPKLELDTLEAAQRQNNQIEIKPQEYKKFIEEGIETSDRGRIKYKVYTSNKEADPKALEIYSRTFFNKSFNQISEEEKEIITTINNLNGSAYTVKNGSGESVVLVDFDKILDDEVFNNTTTQLNSFDNEQSLLLKGYFKKMILRHEGAHLSYTKSIKSLNLKSFNIDQLSPEEFATFQEITKTGFASERAADIRSVLLTLREIANNENLKTYNNFIKVLSAYVEDKSSADMSLGSNKAARDVKTIIDEISDEIDSVRKLTNREITEIARAAYDNEIGK